MGLVAFDIEGLVFSRVCGEFRAGLGFWEVRSGVGFVGMFRSEAALSNCLCGSRERRGNRAKQLLSGNEGLVVDAGSCWEWT